jgi:hypothetical protein
MGPPTCGPPGCIMRPEAIFVNCVYAVKISQYFRNLGVPLVIFPHAALEPAPNYGCGPSPWKGWRPKFHKHKDQAVETGIALGDPAGLDGIQRSIDTCPGPPEQCSPEPSEREANVAAPSSADVKNEWSYTSTPPYAFISWR